MFERIHGLSHAGTRATTRLISSRFVWPNLARDVKTWCQQCTHCCTAKVTCQEKTPVHHIDIPGRKFSHVHVDLVGPWPASADGHTHVLTVVDRTTRWPEACPLKGTTAEEVLQAFISTWVARYGVPERITSDRGVQFTSSTWADWCQQHGVHHITTTAYHPQSNGMVERLHRQMKEALKARGGARAWSEHLPWVMLGIRATPKDACGVSSGETAFGLKLSVPGQLPASGGGEGGASTCPSAIPPTWRSFADVVGKSSPLDEARWVYVQKGGARAPLADTYSGPFQVVERGNKFFRVRIGEKLEVVSRDRLKPHRGTGNPEAASPPPRGRPPVKKTS